MSEWKGPLKCEKCGAITGKDWDGEIEYANGERYHFTKICEKNRTMPLMCDGEMKPYDRRTPDVAKKLDKLLDACRKLAMENDFCIVCNNHPSSGHSKDCPLKEAGDESHS